MLYYIYNHKILQLNYFKPFILENSRIIPALFLLFEDKIAGFFLQVSFYIVL